MKTRLFLSVLSLLLLPLFAQATHINSGYISYTVDPQNPRKFNFTLTLYTNHASPAEDPEVSIHMGDGNTVVVPRTTVTQYNNDYDIETFHWSYTYTILRHYTIAWIGENRNNNIINIPAPSDQISFYTSTTIDVNPLTSNRHGIHLAGVPILDGHVGKPIKHNLAAYDADGDKLAYRLVSPKKQDPQGNIVDIQGYQVPESLTISEYGELNWDAPTTAGRYTIAVQIEEYHNGVVQGTSLVDIEITVIDPTADLRPRLTLLNKSQLSQNEDGSVRVMPGKPLKLEYFMHRNPDHNTPVKVKLYSELDTLELLPLSIATRDSAGGQAITVAFIPGEDLVRGQAYTLAMSAMSLVQDFSTYDPNVTSWEFTYVLVGNAAPPPPKMI